MSKNPKKDEVVNPTVDVSEEEAATAVDPVAQLNDKLLRSYAEFENFKRRTAKEKLELAGYTKANCFGEILSVVDNFERALEYECKDEDFKKGMTMILSQLQNALTLQGIVEIEAIDKPFDPERHNALNQVEDDTKESNTVCGVMQKGYIMGDKVIRHAMVAVVS